MSDDTKARPHVATALIDKQCELAGKIEDLQRQLKIAVTDLDHVEASLRLFVPDIDPTEYGPRPIPTPHEAFKGEVSRILRGALRKAGRPLSTAELTRITIQGRTCLMMTCECARPSCGELGLA